jgi:lipooligosaccharide transport system permease protein
MSETFAHLTRSVPMFRLTEREVRVWSRFWHTSALTGVLIPLLFLGALGLGLGGLVDENQGQVAGFDYLVFVAPGILAATALQAAAGDTLWPVMGGIKWIRSFHAAAATPLTPGQVYGGYISWVGVRLAFNATLFMLVAAALGAVPSPWGVLAVPGAVLGGLAFAAPLAAYSAAQDSDLSFPVIMRVAVMPMFLFSGTFFPIDQLPAALEVVARFTPLWHAVELCRGATTGTLGLVPALVHVGYLAACVAVGCRFGVRTFGAKLAP